MKEISYSELEDFLKNYINQQGLIFGVSDILDTLAQIIIILIDYYEKNLEDYKIVKYYKEHILRDIYYFLGTVRRYIGR